MHALPHVALALTLAIGTGAVPVTLAAQSGGAMTPKPETGARMAHPMAGAMISGRGDHKAAGHLAVATVEGTQVLRLDQGFAVDKGPDVWVVLSRDGNPTSTGAVSVVKLARHTGAQDIAVPAGVDLAQYSHVVFYCRKYKAIMGVAELAAARPMMDEMKPASTAKPMMRGS